MARWKLSCNHYLMTQSPTEWEYMETDRFTGRQIRKRYTIPRLLDVKDPGDWTNKWGPTDSQDGEIIVCLPGKGEAKDIEFLGDPTPDMIPMDDEAKAISEKFTPRWAYKPDGEVTFSQSLVDKFQMEMAEKTAAPQQVEIAGLGELISAMTLNVQQNQELVKALTAKPERRL